MIIGIVFIPIGVGILVSSNKVQEIDVRYDATCDVGSVCDINFTIPQQMDAPVFLYYRLENYYQNHRRYVKSRDDDQLKGLIVSSYGDLSDCDPVISVGDSSNSSLLYNPCGLIAKSLFNDTFLLYLANDTAITLRKDGIAWASDKNVKFKNPPANAPGVRTIPDFEDEDFIVWMRTAGLPDFKKLYRIIDSPLAAGQYFMRVKSYYPVSSFSGKKHFVLSTTTWIGGKNPFLGYAYIVVGAICLVLGIVFGVKHRISPRKLGDTKYLEWNK